MTRDLRQDLLLEGPRKGRPRLPGELRPGRVLDIEQTKMVVARSSKQDLLLKEILQRKASTARRAPPRQGI